MEDGLSLHLSLSLSLTGPLCFLLMNSLVSVLKRTARVRLCLRAAIRGLMVLLTNIWAGVTVAYFTLGFPQPVFISFYICTIKKTTFKLYFYQVISELILKLMIIVIKVQKRKLNKQFSDKLITKSSVAFNSCCQEASEYVSVLFVCY